MSDIFKKLNLKEQAEIVVINAPASFEPELAQLTGISIIRSLEQAGQVTFALSFVTQPDEISAITKTLEKKTPGDAIIWFAYPKGTSRHYTSNVNRDRGWEPLGQAGFEPVRQVAIDQDWSALRFRRVEYIKTMKRREKMALSKQGKDKTRK